MADPVGDTVAALLRERCEGPVTAPAELAGHTTLRVGGAALALVEAAGDGDLAAVGEVCAQTGVPWLVVGRGSNLLVPDEGWPGVAVTLGRAYRGVEVSGREVRAGAAEPLPALAHRVAGHDLTGFAWATAVPGSLGGAVRMNAGAHGSEMADHLVDVELVRLTSGRRETWPVEELGLGYRESRLPGDAVVVAATLRLEAGDGEAARDEMSEIRAWRREHQPVNEPSCGSVFANPPGDSAGRLIETAGAKGMRVGGARVSPVHANFVVTRPEATAEDVRGLIRRVRHRVMQHHGVWLRTEVVVVGGPRGHAD